jgi:hypothetical protein
MGVSFELHAVLVWWIMVRPLRTLVVCVLELGYYLVLQVKSINTYVKYVHSVVKSGVYIYKRVC